MSESDRQQQPDLFAAFGEAQEPPVVAPDARPPPRPEELHALFLRRIRSLEPHTSPYSTFQNFLEMAYCAIAKQTALSAERAQELEDRYMQIVGTLADKSTARAFPELLAFAQLAVSQGGCDFLGRIAGELGVLNNQNGQTFTPYSAARMMATMTLVDARRIIEREGYVTLCEPASGAGVMVLAAADALEEQGFDPSEALLVEATDVASICYHMTFIQLALRRSGIPARVIRGNSLTHELHEWCWTPAALPLMLRHPRMFAKRSNADSDDPAGPDSFCLK